MSHPFSRSNGKNRLNAALITTEEQPYIDQIRAKVLSKYPRLLFALSDNAIKTICIRIVISQVVPEHRLLGQRPRFIQAVETAIESVLANPRQLLEAMTGITGIPDEEMENVMPADDKALALMFSAMTDPYHENRYRMILDMPDQAIALWPTFVLWLYLYHHRAIAVKHYFAMAITLALYTHQFKKLPDNFLELWASVEKDILE